MQLGFLRGVFLANRLASNDDLTKTTKRQNIYQQKLTIHKQQYNIKHAKIYMTYRTRPGLVAFYYIRPGNGVGLFLQPPEPAWGMRKDGIYVLLLTGQHAAWSGVERGQLHQYS